MLRGPSHVFMTSPERVDDRPKWLTYLTCGRSIQAAIAIWSIVVTVVCILVVLDPDQQTVTPGYRQATERWWLAEEDLYSPGISGFVYFPQSAILYTPFTWPPKRIGEVLWRLVSLGLYATSIWRLTRLAPGSGATNLFLMVSLLSLPAALGSARNGQVNMPLAALMIHAAVDLADGRWTRVAAALSLALALKPIAIVMLLLVAAFYRQTRRPLLVGFVMVALLPWLHGDPAFVWRQHLLCFEKLRIAAMPENHRVSDLAGLLNTFGLRAPHAIWMLIRLMAAAAWLGLIWLGFRRLRSHGRALLLLSYAALYLMLFNPRTEANSYVILAPVVALFGAQALLSQEHRVEGWFLAGLALALGSDSYGLPIYDWTEVWFEWQDVWFKPFWGVVFGAYLIWGTLSLLRVRRAATNEKAVPAVEMRSSAD